MTRDDSRSTIDARATHPRMLTHAGLVAPVPRRVRAVADGRTVVDTRAARYVWEHQFYPQFHLPPEAVPDDVVQRTDDTEQTGLGTVERHTLVLGDDRVPGGARRLGEDTTLDGMAGWWRLDWDAFDTWLEEDLPVIAHPRSPYVRVDTLPSSRHVRVEVAGVTLAETTSPVVLVETGLPTRHYIPAEDVDMTHLEPIALRTSCAYKGTVADYWDVRVGDVHVEQAAWRYDDPLPEAVGVAGHVAFLDERVDVVLDGARQPRPTSRHG